MKEKFDPSLLDAGTLIKRGYGAVIANVGKITAVITVIVCALVLFTDITFSNFGTRTFTSTLFVMLLASYLMYFSMEDAGERLGEESEEYNRARENFERLRGEISGDKIAALREFCHRYSLEELEYRRTNLLVCYGYTKEEYEAYKNGALVEKRAIRVFKKADRLRAVTLTPKLLLSNERATGKSELLSPERTKPVRMVLALLPTTLGMLLTVSVMLTAKEDLSAAAVIDGLFKLASLPIIGFRGCAAGYTYAKESLTLWLDTKSRLLYTFLKS